MVYFVTPPESTSWMRQVGLGGLVRARESSLAEASPIGGLGGGTRLDGLLCYHRQKLLQRPLGKGLEIRARRDSPCPASARSERPGITERKQDTGRIINSKPGQGGRVVLSWVVYHLQHGKNHQGHRGMRRDSTRLQVDHWGCHFGPLGSCWQEGQPCSFSG